MTTKAPVGGLVSPINGQFYKGGEFTPDHGHYCGKGKNRVTVIEMADFAEQLMEAKGWTVRFNEMLGRFQIVTETGLIFVSASNLKTLYCFAK